MGKPTRWRRWVGATGGAIVGGILGNVPGAVVGARYGYKRGRERDEEFEGPPKKLPKNKRTMAPFTPSRRRRLSTTSYLFTPGSYRSTGSVRSVRTAGYSRRYGTSQRFRKSRRYRVSKRKTQTKRKNYKKMKRKNYKKRYGKINKALMARSKGMEVKKETYGTLSDEHCIYLKHSTCNVWLMTQAIVGAMVRKVFAKTGYSIANVNDILSGTGFAPANVDASKYRLLFTYFDPTSCAVLELNMTLGSTSTLEDVASGWVNLRALLFNYLTNAGEQIVPKVLALQEYHSGSGETAVFHTQCQLVLENEILNLYVTNVVAFQNRTPNVAHVSGNVPTDVADNQPLKGKLYSFNGGDPRLRATHLGASVTTADRQIQGINAKYGLELVRGSAELPPNWREPPNKDIWANCTSAKNVVIALGETQKSRVTWSVSGRLKNLLPKLRPLRGYLDTTPDPDEPGRVAGVRGKCKVLALEEVVRTPNDNPIIIGYESEYTVGCWLTTKPVVSHISSFSIEPVSNPS